MTIDETLRIEGGRVLATLIRMTRSFDIAEDALQDALVVAHERLADGYEPRNVGAWLTTVARNKALDRLRREAKRSELEREAVVLLSSDSANDATDQLRLLFTCCHPALNADAQVALALRTVAGLTTGEIAKAFLVADTTMGQRISRAKSKIRTAQIPYRVPEDHELPDRLPAVLRTIYVVFTTGHASPFGEGDGRVDLADEAIRLARMLVDLMPDEPECSGLLALCLASRARQAARFDEQGNFVRLADQDRSQWQRAMIDEAVEIVERSLQRRRVGPYQLQAAISTLHSGAESFVDTDWTEIADLYRLLESIEPSQVVTVNRAVAESYVRGPTHALDLLDRVEGLSDWHLYWATRADLLRRLAKHEQAIECLRRALTCDMSDTDRSFLTDQLADLVSVGRDTANSK